MSNADPSSPAVSYDEALRRFDALRSRDGDEILPGAGSTLLSHGERAPRAVVLFHGFTNCPLQYSRFAAERFARGDDVVVPRFPGHGRADRDPRPLGSVPAAAFLATAFEAFDLACGLGERVAVLGISSGGALAARVAFDRAACARAVCVAPLFGLLKLPQLVDAALAPLLAMLPNVDLAWDPSGKNDEIPPYSYTHFPTRALGELLGIGLDVAASHVRPLGGGAVIVTNTHDPAISNELADAAGRRWNRARSGFADAYVFRDLPENHDIIDPDDARQRVDAVYPVLHDLLDRS